MKISALTMRYEIQRTNNFRFQYNKLALKHKRFVEEAIDVLKETPDECQGKITPLARKKNGRLYRFRVPGAHILYIIHSDEPIVTMTQIKVLR